MQINCEPFYAIHPFLTHRNANTLMVFQLFFTCLVEEGDVSASSISANMQQLNIQEERHLDEPEEDVPAVVIPNHLQVQTADCSHLSFGSFGATTMNPVFPGSFASRQLRSKMEDTHAEADTSPVGHSDAR